MTATTKTESRKTRQMAAPYRTRVTRIPTAIFDSVTAMSREFKERAWAEYREQQREANP